MRKECSAKECSMHQIKRMDAVDRQTGVREQPIRDQELWELSVRDLECGSRQHGIRNMGGVSTGSGMLQPQALDQESARS